MKTPDFRPRPTAQIALRQWLDTKSNLDLSIARWRLRKRNESVGERALLDVIAVARGGIQSVKNMLSPQVSASFWDGSLSLNSNAFSDKLRAGQIHNLIGTACQ
jgi:hypothetical protein